MLLSFKVTKIGEFYVNLQYNMFTEVIKEF